MWDLKIEKQFVLQQARSIFVWLEIKSSDITFAVNGRCLDSQKLIHEKLKA